MGKGLRWETPIEKSLSRGVGDLQPVAMLWLTDDLMEGIEGTQLF